MIEKINKSNEEWKRILTPEQYRIMREKGTEPPFSCMWGKSGEKGTYHCAACDLPLFLSEEMYESGTGWPSYFQPINPEHIVEHSTGTFGMPRVEVSCARCEGHLGHVFNDGPPQTGKRYCINSVALKFVPGEK